MALAGGRHYTRLSLPAVLTQRSGWALKPGDVEREREREHDGRGSPLLSFLAKQTQKNSKERCTFAKDSVAPNSPSPGERKRQGRERKVWMPDRGEGTIKAQAEGPPGSPPSTGGTQVAKARFEQGLPVLRRSRQRNEQAAAHCEGPVSGRMIESSVMTSRPGSVLSPTKQGPNPGTDCTRCTQAWIRQQPVKGQSVWASRGTRSWSTNALSWWSDP